jgi:hypothetical protein
MERPERIGLLALGLILGYKFLMAVMMLLAATTMVTVVQRIHHVQKESKRLEGTGQASNNSRQDVR